MDLTDFNQNYLNGLLYKISKEEKNIFLLGDFNISWLNYNEHRPTNDFFDLLASSSYSYSYSYSSDLLVTPRPLLITYFVILHYIKQYRVI